VVLKGVLVMVLRVSWYSSVSPRCVCRVCVCVVCRGSRSFGSYVCVCACVLVRPSNQPLS